MSHEEQFLAAIRAGDVEEVLACLEDEPDLLDTSATGAPSLVMLALYNRQPEVADALVEAGPRLNIFEAAAAGRLPVVRELVAEDPRRVNAVAADGFQPLGLAAFYGDADVVDFLLEHGAAVNAASANAQKVQPLHSAVAGRHGEIVRMLLEHGADPNARQQKGLTPLHAAASAGRRTFVKMLLQYGADPSLIADDGRSAADFASEAGHFDLAERLDAAEKPGLDRAL